jgi:hypothetical protein
MCISILGNRPFSTSLLILLIMNGRRILCSYLIISSFFFSRSASLNSRFDFAPRSNHSSKSSLDWKISGRRKFNNDHNSCRLFCSGVPVKSSLYLELNWRIVFEVYESLFLILWASSIIMYSQLNFFSEAIHNLTPSNVVIQTSNLPG